jgi:hypothetical protein
MTSLRLDDGAARHDRRSHFVMNAAQRQSHFVIEGESC